MAYMVLTISLGRQMFFIFLSFFIGTIVMHNIWVHTGHSKPTLKGYKVISNHGPMSPVKYVFYDGDILAIGVECENSLYEVKVK